MAIPTRTFRFHDRKALQMPWGEGPWDREMDKMQWPDGETRLPCIVRRNHMGNLCGYVGVYANNPFHGLSMEEVNFDVHGGVTYAARMTDAPARSGLCFDGTDEEVFNVWLFGFDCGHHMDIIPSLFHFSRVRESDVGAFDLYGGSLYRDMGYVMGECARLAAQLQPPEPVVPEPKPHVPFIPGRRIRRLR